MANVTYMDDNPFADVNPENNTLSYDDDHSTLRTVSKYWNVFTAFAVLITCVVNISAGIFLLVVIRRYKALRTRVNTCLFHCVLNILLSYFSVIVTVVGAVLFRTSLVVCSLASLAAVFLSLGFIFAGLLCIDWYLVHVKTNYLQKYKKIFNHILITIYCLGLVQYSTNIGFCFVRSHRVNEAIFCNIYLSVFLITNFVLYTTRKRNRIDNHISATYSVIIGNVIVYSWLWLGVYGLIEIFFRSTQFYKSFLEYFIIFTQIMPDILAHSNLIVIVYLLGRLNKHFKMAYGMAFKRNLRNYGHNELDQSEADITVQHQVGDNGVLMFERGEQNEDTDGDFVNSLMFS